MLLLTRLAFCCALCAFTGCTSFIDATTATPIEQDIGKRSFGRFIDDENLETILEVNLRKTGPGLSDSHINVTSFNGVILLTGEVPSKALKQLAGETIRTTENVRQVHNQLLVKNNSTVFSRTNDSWLSTKVRSKFVSDGRVEAERVKVVTENRIVYLMGLLTHAEANIVSELAASIPGVEQVVRVVEHIER